MSHDFDVVVLGVGGIGSATMYELARRGLRVLGIDQFAPGHDRGSSHGETRVIRTAYFEHPNYVPLAQRAFQMWRQLEALVDGPLLVRTGLLQGGPPQGVVVAGIRQSAARFALDVQTWSHTQGPSCFSWNDVTADHALLFEADAGYLLVEDCVRAHAEAASRYGATMIADQVIVDWQANDRGCSVITSTGRVTARHLVLALGAGQRDLCRIEGLALRVLRKHIYWYAFQPQSTWEPVLSALPIFLFESASGVYYGFPSLDGTTIKVARHSGGVLIADDPFAPTRVQDPADRQLVETFLCDYFANLSFRLARESTCLYTMTPDEHFRVGFHPRYRNVVVAAGLSGHGFKFAPVLGACLADLIEHGSTEHPIDFLSPVKQ